MCCGINPAADSGGIPLYRVSGSNSIQIIIMTINALYSSIDIDVEREREGKKCLAQGVASVFGCVLCVAELLWFSSGAPSNLSQMTAPPQPAKGRQCAVHSGVSVAESA